MTSEEGQAWVKRPSIVADWEVWMVYEDDTVVADFIPTEALADRIIADHAAARDREALEARVRDLEAALLTARLEGELPDYLMRQIDALLLSQGTADKATSVEPDA